MKRHYAVTLLCASAALVAGCGKRTPSGQVAATVNGKEVTLQEVNTELQAANIPPNADKQQVQRALLQQVIERKLLVQTAEDAGIDKTPEFLAQKRRAEEMMLVQAYAKKQLAVVPVPSAADIDKYVNDHPNIFAHREILKLDQIRFPRPADAGPLNVLRDDHTLDAVAATLTKLGIKFERGFTSLDTAAVPTDVMTRINALPAGEPFVAPSPQGVTINVVMARVAQPIDPVKARPAATSAWRQQKFGELLKSRIDALKGTAKINYQNGFGPPAAPKAPGAPAPAAAPAGAATPAPAGS